jgi:hypothetical protein
MRTSGMGCGGGGRGCGPFYRAGEAGRRLVRGETAGGRWSFTPSVFEAKTRGGKAWRQLVGGETAGGWWSFTLSVFKAETRGGKAGRHHLGGGNEEGGASVRFGYSHVEGSNRRWHRPGLWRLVRDRGRRRLVWASDVPKGQNELGQRENFSRRTVRASNIVWAEMEIGIQIKYIFKFKQV